MSTRIEKYLAKRDQYGATHYKGNNTVVFEHGKGIYLRDVEGKVYIDAAAGYSSVNLGHNHPKICEVGRKLYEVDADGWGPVSVVPNSFLTVAQADFLEYSCEFFEIDKALATNGGVEGVETAIKLILKWGYTKRKNRIPKERGLIIMFEGNFHGRTTSVIAGSSEKKYKEFFGPYAGNIITISYNDTAALENVLRKNKDNVAGIVIEPIQGEGGVRIPDVGYLARCYDLCKKYDVVFCADEIQTGLGRTGTLLACHHDNVRPDMFILAKSLGAGKNAVAIVFAKDEFMCFEPGDHGSTYGGNTAAMTLAQSVLQIIKDEKLCEKSARLGPYLIEQITNELATEKLRGYWKDIRGRGLMIGIELEKEVSAEHIVDLLLLHNVVTKDAHNVIRITPPLIITQRQCDELAWRIGGAFRDYAKELVL